MAMDFEGAILAHTRWKRRLHASLSGGAHLDPVETARDDRCELGQWIALARAELAERKDFLELMVAHGRFHLAAADVVRTINAGETERAAQMLGFGGEFTLASTEVVRALTLMRINDAPSPGPSPR